MKLKTLAVTAFSCLSLTIAAHANEVQLIANQPMKIAFRVAHQNQGGQPVFGELQTIDVSKTVTIPVDLNQYELAGVVIISASGHVLPPSVNQFDKPKQCAMTTDKIHAAGTLAFTLSEHAIGCSSQGGIFG